MKSKIENRKSKIGMLIIALMALCLCASVVKADDIPPARPVPLTEIETLKIKDTNQRRTILLLRMQALEAEYKQLQAELRQVAAEQARVVQEAAKAHGVDLKTHQLDAELKSFVVIPAKEEVKK